MQTLLQPLSALGLASHRYIEIGEVMCYGRQRAKASSDFQGVFFFFCIANTSAKIWRKKSDEVKDIFFLTSQEN